MSGATRTRAGAHYKSNRMYRDNPRKGCVRFMERDAAYRNALGLADGEDIPRALGVVGRNHVPDETEQIM